jgi:hypothetical protein
MLALMESDEATDDQIEAAFGAITEKDNRIAHLRADLLGDIAKFEAEEQRLAAGRERMESLVKRLEGFITQSMDRLGVEEIKTGTFCIDFQKNPPAVEVEDEKAIPAKYFIVIPKTLQLDKKRVASDLKAGKKVNGCTLKQGKRLRIR